MSLVSEIRALKAGPVGHLVRKRMKEFAALGRRPIRDRFIELCFCLLTANYTSEGGMRIQKEINRGFLTLPQAKLAKKLKALGYRFPNTRARYIIQTRKQIWRIDAVLRTAKTPGSQKHIRQWLAENILGLGYKEASHFLRNIGCFDLAIIDFHVLDALVSHGLVSRPKSKSLGRNSYLEIESQLAKLASKLGISQGELDLYLWYHETGKVLK